MAEKTPNQNLLGRKVIVTMGQDPEFCSAEDLAAEAARIKLLAQSNPRMAMGCNRYIGQEAEVVAVGFAGGKPMLTLLMPNGQMVDDVPAHWCMVRPVSPK